MALDGTKLLSFSLTKSNSTFLFLDFPKILIEDDNIQAIIINGGTGISKRDVTVDSVEPLFEKKLDGFGEVFRYLSYKEIGSAAMMSRAIAGVANLKVIICMPGSPNAAKLAMEKLILKELGHMVWEAGR